MDVEVLKLTPEFVQVDATARGNFTWKLGFWYCPLNPDGIIPFLRHIYVWKNFLKTHDAAVLLLWLLEMSNELRLTALVSRELLRPCYCKPQAGRVSPAHAQWILARKSYSWRDHAPCCSLSLVIRKTTWGVDISQNSTSGGTRVIKEISTHYNIKVQNRKKTRPPLQHSSLNSLYWYLSKQNVIYLIRDSNK